ncbi:MAG: glycosyltransferase family 39 protein [Acidobacteriaceae bacterium]
MARHTLLALRDARRAQGRFPLWMLFPVFFVLVYLSHGPLLRLPYYWDEAGYYIPAAYDFFRTGSLIPFSTLSNAHPPLPSILLAAWWHLSGFVPSGTRTAMCLVSALALLGVFRLSRTMVRTEVAAVITFLTGLYPVWFAQSTLAHADMFAAAATLWALSFYFERGLTAGTVKQRWLTAILFSLAALSKETAIVTPAALALWEAVRFLRSKTSEPAIRSSHLRWAAALLAPILPLAGWYAYHFHKTGFIFGNPEYLRYNATTTLEPLRIVLAFGHRILHVTAHMNLFVPVLCTVAAMLLPPLTERDGSPRPRIAIPLQAALGVVLLANLLFFSVVGGALLTRYLLPLYPLVLLECVSTWRRRVRQWWLLVLLSTVAFLAGLFINPPYRFAPEDNLSYRDMIVLQQQAIAQIVKQWPQATVLTAWPASDELRKPELGYVTKPVKTVEIDDFSLPEMQKALKLDETYDTALIFSTKYDPPNLLTWMHLGNAQTDAKYFGFHQDLSARQTALLLHGTIVWQAERNGLWAAVLRFHRTVDAQCVAPASPFPSWR